MKTDTLLFCGALAAIAILMYQARKTSTSTNSSGAGGAPAWAATTGPVGATYDLLTGTMEMKPLVPN